MAKKNPGDRAGTTFEFGDEPWRCCAKAKGKSRIAGEPVRCGNRAVRGRKVCRFHGGHAGRYPIHGRYSKGLGRLNEAYEATKNDPALMDLRETLALIDLAVQDAAKRAAEFDTAEFRERAVALFLLVEGELEKSEILASPVPVGPGGSSVSAPGPRLAGETETESAAGKSRLKIAVENLGVLLREGAGESEALDQLAKAAERLARRQEKAWGIRLDAATAMNAREVMGVLAKMMDVVLEEAPKDAGARIIRRVDVEIMGAGQAAARIEVGDAT